MKSTVIGTNEPMRGTRRVLGLCTVVGLLAMGCGGAAAPNTQLTSAEAAVRAAEQAGAQELPRGELHLKYARDAVTEARALMEEKENERATLLLERAIVDADLALALAEDEEARVRANEELARIEELMKK